MLLKGRLFAAIAAGVVISTGIIAMSGGSAVSNSNSTSGAAFRIETVTFAETGFNSSSCSLLDGVVFVKIVGLSGDQQLTSVNIGGQEINLDHTYTHAGETTTIVLDFPWLQGYKYHLTVTSQSQITAEADIPVTPIVAPTTVTLKSISLKGPSLGLSVENNGSCTAYLTQVVVSGPNIANDTSIPITSVAVEPSTSLSIVLPLNFYPQIHGKYSFILTVAGWALTATAIATSAGGGGDPTIKPN